MCNPRKLCRNLWHLENLLIFNCLNDYRSAVGGEPLVAPLLCPIMESSKSSFASCMASATAPSACEVSEEDLEINEIRCMAAHVPFVCHGSGFAMDISATTRRHPEYFEQIWLRETSERQYCEIDSMLIHFAWVVVEARRNHRNRFPSYFPGLLILAPLLLLAFRPKRRPRPLVSPKITRVPQKEGWCRGGSPNVERWGIPLIENKSKL